ncbi:hypothetical protein PSHT_03466 [Puccinia striiformis]|uniref:20S-pre-rRNA D-site endonuclease NOB1 n=1 Tax=Puccinia striiformis TaxID=27350 RepID=A0A2S4WFM7_9BASI|nr:hypothetical protein PSHT_03466 [Puccinia striiformis]
MPSHDRTQTLVLDTAPLLTSSLSSLLHFSNRFDVIEEVRGKGQRERLEQEWKILDATLNNSANQSGDEWTGLQVREPSTAGISKIKEFATKTGDIAVLSSADIRVLALAYDVEVEANGTWRLRDTLEWEKTPKRKRRDSSLNVTSQSDNVPIDPLENASDIDWVKSAAKHPKKNQISHLGSPPRMYTSTKPKTWGSSPSLGNKPAALKPETTTTGSSNLAEQEHKQEDQDSDINTPIATSTVGEGSSKAPTMKAAVLTGDYAMQNVALQIGLNVLGVGGTRIRDVKTWVLRCYGCFKLCKDPTRKFCPKCGGATLTRVSITYTPSSPTGYILHLNPNFQYRNRGTVYSIPSAKPGSASFEKGGAKQNRTVNGANLVLREDQKEFQRGLKSVMIKTERRTGWNDPDWEPAMYSGEKGRKSGGRGGNHHNDHVGMVKMVFLLSASVKIPTKFVVVARNELELPHCIF